MSDPISALDGRTAKGAVTVTERGLQGMITLRGDLSSDSIRSAATSVSGTDMPGQRQINLKGERGLAWMSPDELLILLPYAEAQSAATTLASTLGDTHHLAVNVSDARAVFRLTGAHVREVIAKGAPVDLHPDVFKPGEIRRTRLGQVAVAFWLVDGETLDLVCFRSVAGFVFDWLTHAARDGAEVGFLA